MDATLLWLLIAIHIRPLDVLDRAATARLARRSGVRPHTRQAFEPHGLLAAARLAVLGRLETLRLASAALWASRKGGRVQARSAWVQALGEVSLVPVNKKR